MTWWAAYCEPKRELLARDALVRLGMDVFCPYEVVMKRMPKKWGRSRIAEVVEVAFPRYLFVDGVDASLVRQARGVVSVVSTADGPLEVPELVVRRMRGVADAFGCTKVVELVSLATQLGLAEGDSFVFGERSPLAGLAGLISSLSKLESTGEVRAWVDLLGRKSEVALSYKDVEAVRQRTAPRVRTRKKLEVINGSPDLMTA